MSEALHNRNDITTRYLDATRYAEVAEPQLAKSLNSLHNGKGLSGIARAVHAVKRVFTNCVFSPAVLAATVVALAFLPERYLRQGVAASAISDLSSLTKRTLDIIGGMFGLVLTSPFFVILPLIIKLDSPGPIFYVQKRVGRDRRRTERRRGHLTVPYERRNGDRRKMNQRGMLFNMYKFRTMRADAERKSGPVWATRNDPRITRCGRILRLTRLDEIPQFLNVLKGEMSLVGPRPERPEFVEDLARRLPDYTRRLRAKPGITGIAQVETGYDSSIDDVRTKLMFDIEYVERANLLLDARIMLKTIWVVLTGKGAV